MKCCEDKVIYFFHVKVERVTNKMVEDKKEYDLRLQEYAQLLDIRAERIKVIHCLKNPAPLLYLKAETTIIQTSGGHFAKYWGGGGGGGEIFNMYAFGVRLRYANLSNIMLGISNSLFHILL